MPIIPTRNQDAVDFGKYLSGVEMPDPRRTARTKSGTTPATFAERFIDDRHPSAFIEFDGGIGAQLDAGLASRADIRINPGDGGGNFHLPQGRQCQRLRRRA